MKQRMKIDVVLFIIGITFLTYSMFGAEMFSADAFRFLIGVEFILGALYLILAPENKWR